MKKVLVLLVLFTTAMMAQERVTINVTQDARLLFSGDNKGNKAGTIDLTIASEWQGNQQDFGYMLVRPEFEIAELAGGTYRRYSANVGYSFNKWLDKVTFTTTAGYGIIDYNGGYRGFGANFQTSYKILDYLELFLDLEVVDRTDLSKYGEEFPSRVRTSGKFGCKLYLDGLW